MIDLDAVRKVFSDDRFAKLAGAEILAADEGYARCKMRLQDCHRNGMDEVMGGAVYTLADFAFAVASNVGRPATVTLDSSVTFLRNSKGKTLYAEARCVKDGRSTCLFDVSVTDDLGAEIAVCRSNGIRVGKESLIPAPVQENARYRMAIFDLDGTILSTLEDLTASVCYALESCGLPTLTLEEVQAKVGNGFGKLIERSVPEAAGEEVRARVGECFRAHYAEHCMEATHPYDGITEMFRKLRSRGVLLAVLSNKGNSAVQPMMQKYFPGLLDAAYGERPGIRRKPAPDSVNSLLAEYGVAPKDAVYIGDSDVDIDTAAAAGLDCLSVSWGFRSEEFLQEHGASRIIGSVRELTAAILG